MSAMLTFSAPKSLNIVCTFVLESNFVPTHEGILFLESKFSLRDYNRFGIDILSNNGFHVSVWDFTSALHDITVNENIDFENNNLNLIEYSHISDILNQMKSIIGSSKDLPDYKLEKERYWIDEAYKFLRKNGVELA